MIQVTIASPDGEQLVREFVSFVALTSQLQDINHKLDRVLHREQRAAIDLSTVLATVTEAKTIEESIKVLVEGLSQTDQSPEVQALTATLKASSDDLIKAVQANTQSST